MDTRNKKIAFCDSGVGGLTVFSKIKEVLPNENYIYFGDLKNSPYGEKTKEELIKISQNVFNFFKSQDIKAVVMACNTTSAVTYEVLKSEYNFKIYPIIQCCAKEIANMNFSNICVFATEATVNSHAYKKYINKFNPSVNVKEIACPSWVKLVEENKISSKECDEEVKKYLDKALETKPDKIILGCTHYPFLINTLHKFSDKNLFLNPADIFVNYIKKDLSENYMLSNSPCGQEEFYVSAKADKFYIASELFYKLKDFPKKIEIS